MNSAYRRIELPAQLGEIGRERGAPPDQHIIVAGAKRRSGGEPHHFAEPPAHAVAHDRIADLARHGEANPDGSGVVLGALAGLQEEAAGRRSCAFRGSLEIRAALQPFHWLGLALAAILGSTTAGSTSKSACGTRTRAPTKSLSTQLLAPLRTPQRQNPAAALGRHAGAKAVAALAHQFARLIGPFHRKISAGGSMRRQAPRLARLIRKPSRLVNVTSPRFVGDSGILGRLSLVPKSPSEAAFVRRRLL
jgi:hypothetical protein